MSRIAYVDHSYHRQTVSTDFIPQMLRRAGHEVDYFWDEAWRHGPAIPWSAVSAYDAVVMFQIRCALPQGEYFRALHPNVTYIPMLDQWGLWNGPFVHLGESWEPLQGCKAINFSSAAQAVTVGFGIRSLQVQYFQQPLAEPCAPAAGLHGFFWLRREEQIPWSTVRALIGEARFDTFHVHLVPDPFSHEPTAPPSEDCRRYNITTSTWFDSKAQFTEVLERANVFFAPRMAEGIGQSFLEALCRGQCVVAPNHGTMNEYILDGVNGLLYDSAEPRPLDFSRVIELGRAGWQAARRGYQRWLEAEERIVHFILTPSAELYTGRYNHFARPPAASSTSTLASLRAQVLAWPVVQGTRRFWQPVWQRLGKRLLR